EASALKWADVNLESKEIRILKSHYMGTDSATKTTASKRPIEIDQDVVEVLKLLPSRELGIESVFVNKYGDPMNAKKWSEHNWKEPLETLGIRHRKFYATRHTFITEAIKRGENLLAVAQYCGTSLAMIGADSCATLGLSLDQTVFEPLVAKALKGLVAGPGFEPGTSRL